MAGVRGGVSQTNRFLFQTLPLVCHMALNKFLSLLQISRLKIWICLAWKMPGFIGIKHDTNQVLLPPCCPWLNLSVKE